MLGCEFTSGVWFSCRSLHSVVWDVAQGRGSMRTPTSESRPPRPEHPELIHSGRDFLNGAGPAARYVPCQEKHCSECWGGENIPLQSQKLVGLFKATQGNLKCQQQCFFTQGLYNPKLYFGAFLVLNWY